MLSRFCVLGEFEGASGIGDTAPARTTMRGAHGPGERSESGSPGVVQYIDAGKLQDLLQSAATRVV